MYACGPIVWRCACVSIDFDDPIDAAAPVVNVFFVFAKACAPFINTLGTPTASQALFPFCATLNAPRLTLDRHSRS
jgi:hypothetical protein